MKKKKKKEKRNKQNRTEPNLMGQKNIKTTITVYKTPEKQKRNGSAIFMELPTLAVYKQYGAKKKQGEKKPKVKMQWGKE